MDIDQRIKNKAILIVALFVVCINMAAQDKSLVNTSESPYASLRSVDIYDVRWTEGFWAERFSVCRQSMVPHMMGNYLNDSLSHAFANFEIAAGLKEGKHKGPPFHDGDFYKILEGMIMANYDRKDERTEKQIDSIIAIIALTQREDGYIHTPVMIEQRKEKDRKKEFAERLDFETYNMGHLMTAACLHFRVTGKTSLLNIAKKAADFLCDFCERNPAELAKNAICPSHYMGIVELYRTTHDRRYLDLAKTLINIRSMVKNGSDDNQDRIPFREQNEAVGHAVRANYLYAGVTDVFLETGEDSLFNALDALWHNVTEKKMYITGGCGALYNGVSPDGTTYKQEPVQQVHQAYGRDYQLPNLTAHNESCANIGNLLWNWRLLLATGDAKYADIMEMVMYNSLLAGVSLDGKGYFYTNPLRVSEDITYTLRWSKVREPYISYCNCCPPNTIRTIAEIQNYFYCISDAGLWVNFYGGNTLSTHLRDGSLIQMTQKTDFPYDEGIRLVIEKVQKSEFSLFLRIPSWAEGATIKVNGSQVEQPVVSGKYAEINRLWKSGDVIDLILPLQVNLFEANPLVEETLNQVAVKRGPVVYCLESADLPADHKIFDVTIPSSVLFMPEKDLIGESNVVTLSGEVMIAVNQDWNGRLYRRISKEKYRKAIIKLIPYYAWGNRGKGDMTVWIPVSPM
ncbi:MAG: glycoside hydrolase family 127 protein [Bacteroidales bacterium]|nr:glycoside hydrolase family 127 protein [Bacteroidales bacterium]MBN2763795.1 glycoside hydrolase family 127 protein [Bacteroidales bacterium]